MKWHAQKIRCSRAVVLRGYRKGSYAEQSPYQALLLILSRAGLHEIQGFLSTGRMTRLDRKRIEIACRRLGIRQITTRRHGRLTEFC